MRSGDAELAWQFALYVLQSFPKSLWAHTMTAEKLAHQGRDTEALEHYAIVIASDPLNAATHASMGALALKLGRYDRASRYELLAEDHRDARLEVAELSRTVSPSRLAVLQERSGLLPQSVDSLNHALEIDATRVDLYLLLARSLFRLRRFEAAEEATITILSAYPDCLEANVIAAALFSRRGRMDESMGFLEAAYESDPIGTSIRSTWAGQELVTVMASRKPPEIQVPADERLQTGVATTPQAVETVPLGAEELEAESEANQQRVAPDTEDEPAEDGHEVRPVALIGASFLAQKAVGASLPAHEPGPDHDQAYVDARAVTAFATNLEQHDLSDLAEDVEEPGVAAFTPGMWTETGQEVSPLLGTESVTTKPEPPESEIEPAASAEVDLSDGEPIETAAVTQYDASRDTSFPEAADVEIGDSVEAGVDAETELTLTAELDESALQNAPSDELNFPDFEAWFQENVLDPVEAEFGHEDKSEEQGAPASPSLPGRETNGAIAEDDTSTTELVAISAFAAAESYSAEEHSSELEDTGEAAEQRDASSEVETQAVSGQASPARLEISAGVDTDAPTEEGFSSSGEDLTQDQEFELDTESGSTFASTSPDESVGLTAFTYHEADASSPTHAEVDTPEIDERAIGTAEAPEIDEAADEVAIEAAEALEIDEAALETAEAPESETERRSQRRRAMPRFSHRKRDQPIKSKLADLAETVGQEPLNNGLRYEMAQALETADPAQAVAQYAIIVSSRDPRLVADIRARLEALLTSGIKVHGLQRLLGDVCMQQGAFERAIEAYGLAFDELRSRQITDKEMRP